MSHCDWVGGRRALGHYRIQHLEAGGGVWATNGYRVYYSDDHGESFTYRASFAASRLRESASRFRPAWRLLRGGILAVHPLADGGVIASVRGSILRADKDSTRLEPVFSRPSRTFRFERTPDGTLYTGEYFYNRDRSEVQILASEDGGARWFPAHTFAAGEIRHVHSVRYDPYRKGLVVATGDLENENRILFTADHFSNVDTLAAGSQRARAYDVICTESGYYLPTDTQYEQNYIQFLSLNGELRRIVPIAGSCLGACAVGGAVFFATAAENTHANLDPHPTLYGSVDGVHWEVVERWLPDRWSRGPSFKSTLFQYARVLLPSGPNKTDWLFATTVAVDNADGVLHRWRIDVHNPFATSGVHHE